MAGQTEAGRPAELTRSTFQSLRTMIDPSVVSIAACPSPLMALGPAHLLRQRPEIALRLSPARQLLHREHHRTGRIAVLARVEVVHPGWTGDRGELTEHRRDLLSRLRPADHRGDGRGRPTGRKRRLGGRLAAWHLQDGDSNARARGRPRTRPRAQGDRAVLRRSPGHPRRRLRRPLANAASDVRVRRRPDTASVPFTFPST